MKQYEIVYSDFQKMQDFIYSNNINDNDNIFVQVFTAVIGIEFINNVISEITSILPNAKIIGATTAGEIYNGNVFSNTTIISFTIFDKVKIKTKLLIGSDEYGLGVDIAKDLIEYNTKVVILFSDGLRTNGYKIIKGIESVNNCITICGGQAGDNGYLKETFVFTNQGITKNGVAAVSLSGQNLNVITDHSFSWSSIGKLMTITKAVNNRIFTIDDIKAGDIYKKYLGHEVAEELPMSATEFPLIIKKNGMNIARVPFECYDDGSLSFLGNVEVNDKVQFGYGNVNMITSQALEMTSNLRSKSVEAIFVYSCSVRRNFMQDKINIETSALNGIAPTFGFFTYGEFFKVNHSNELLNTTMTILAISEGEQIHHKNKVILTNKNQGLSKSFFEGKDIGVIKVFTNLVNQVTEELQTANKELEKQKHKVEQMNNATKVIMEINNDMLSSCEVDNLFKNILDKVFKVFPNCDIGSILLMKDNKFSYKATRGYVLNKVGEIKYLFKNMYQYRTYGIYGLLKPMIVTNLEKNLFDSKDDYNSWKELLIKTPHELLTCSIGVNGHILGFINIFNTDKNINFNEEDKKLFEYLCNDINIVLKNAQLLENILYMSKYDCLTGIYNRHYFRKVLYETMSKAKLLNEIFVICVIDLNDFKNINDRYGHTVGDKLLIKFVNIFKTQICDDDVFGRIGGDEFEVIFLNKNKAQVIDIMDKICMFLKKYRFDLDRDKKEISFAYGVSEFSTDSDNVNELLKMADKKMYEKKMNMKQDE